MLLPDLLSESAARFPEKPCLVSAEGSISYGLLDRMSGRVASRLEKLGVGPGHRVVVLYENRPAAVVFFWGILKRGARVVDVPSLLGTAVIERILEECRPHAIVCSERQLDRLASALSRELFPSIVFTENGSCGSTERFELGAHSLSEICETEEPRASFESARESDVAVVIYTSGSTGEPKGVMLSHHNLISNLRAANELMGLTSADSILLVVPLAFVHGRMQLLLHTWIGGKVALSRGLRLPQQVLRELVEYGVTGLSGVPYHFSALLARSDLKKVRLPHLRYVLVTGGAMLPSALNELAESLPPGVGIHLAYGLTEASPRVTHLGPEEISARPGSCGRALPGVKIEIVDDQGKSLDAGLDGEVVVSGPNVMQGYVSGDERTSGSIDDLGRLHTGDIGKLDTEGYLFIVGRKSEMIKSSGERVFPQEIEKVIDSYDGVAESAVLGLPDSMLGERIAACVVPAPGHELDGERLRQHCRRFLPFTRTPREVRILEVLPKTPSGKIDRGRLQALWTIADGKAASGKE